VISLLQHNTTTVPLYILQRIHDHNSQRYNNSWYMRIHVYLLLQRLNRIVLKTFILKYKQSFDVRVCAFNIMKFAAYNVLKD